MYPHYWDFFIDLRDALEDDRPYTQRVETDDGAGMLITHGDAYAIAWDDGAVKIWGSI
jgi:hypothetical protein